MNALVPQSPADKFLAGYFLNKKIAEIRNDYDYLKTIKLQTEDKMKEARCLFENRIQPLQVQLNMARMKSGKSQPVQENHIDKMYNNTMNNEVTLLNGKRLYYYIAKMLHCQGGFRDNALMDRASQAFKSSDIAELFEIWEKTQKLVTNSTKPHEYQKNSEDAFLEKVRMLIYLQVSVDIMQDKVLRLKKNPLLLAYVEGKKSIEEAIKSAEDSIQAELNSLENSFQEKE